VSVRVQSLIDGLAAAGVDLMLISETVNVRYLTGYTGSNALALLGPQTRVFITDFRYVVQAAEQVNDSFERLQAPRDLIDAVGDALPDAPLRLGFEAAHVSVRDHSRLRELLPDEVELVGVCGIVERLRAVKDRDELARIKIAAQLADAAFQRVIGEGLIGRTEREVAIALEHYMQARGARRASFDPIVAAGAHGALPHAEPRDVEIRRGDLVVIDWGAELDGYCFDCTRTVGAGEPSADAMEIYALVLEAQQAGLAAVKAGESGRAVDAVARSLIDSGGHGEHFGHGLGHGVGLEVHEAPRLSQRAHEELRSGNVVTVEPGIYLPGRFGVRIEDLVLVTDNGAEVLTAVPKPLIVAP
jgi:Xaa-Pro aminopeptidase